MEALIAILTAKNAARITVYKILDLLYSLRRITADCGALRDKTTYKSILILITSSLRRTIRMAIIHRRSFLTGVWRILHSNSIGELGAVITSDRFKDLPKATAAELTFQAIKHRDRACGRLIPCLKHNFHTGETFRQTKECLTLFLRSYNRIKLPMPEGGSLRDLLRAFFYTNGIASKGE